MKKINASISNVFNFVVDNWYSILSGFFYAGSIIAGLNHMHLAWIIMLGFGTVLSAASLIIQKLNFIEETQDREISRTMQKEWQQFKKSLNEIKKTV